MEISPRTVRLPSGLESLAAIALDLRWTWSHWGDALWKAIDPDRWERTENPYLILQSLGAQALKSLAENPEFAAKLDRFASERDSYYNAPTWWSAQTACEAIRGIAYFSMEFGLSKALPLYAGGLGILAGDYLKAASDLGVPVYGIGLLYQEGYFHQLVDEQGQQQAVYPYNDPMSLPVTPTLDRNGAWLYVEVEFPGRKVRFRVWRAQVGRVTLYLLDSNDPWNDAVDRGITAKLYGGTSELRLTQEMALGVGGWRIVEALELPIDVCHLNEGHAAFAAMERARNFRDRNGCDFWEALWATRAGNVFTTHTPVAAAFDTFHPGLILNYGRDYIRSLGVTPEELAHLAWPPGARMAPVSMAYIAARGCSQINAVSELHARVSRGIFAALYPRWPISQIPISHVTNGVHMPSWDSPAADDLWTQACGAARWRGDEGELSRVLGALPDEKIWASKGVERAQLVTYVRQRLARQLARRGQEHAEESVAAVLDPNALTLGFARRFAEYKRPHLLLNDVGRLRRLLTNKYRPVQLLIAGKAHPDDAIGKGFIEQWLRIAQDSELRNRIVFLEDYDIGLAEQMVQGVDVWINVPRRSWEACGTSGMKVLVNGGLNVSTLDGWWAEAYDPDVGWAIGDAAPMADSQDANDALELYEALERQIVPLFYERDRHDVPRGWIAKIRASMAKLTPRFSTNRMIREYVERLYCPAAATYRDRARDRGALARDLYRWEMELRKHWSSVRIASTSIEVRPEGWLFRATAYLGEVDPRSVQVQLYADPRDHASAPACELMQPMRPVTGVLGGYEYELTIPPNGKPGDYTPRIVPYHPAARVPTELALICWP
jgi:starch phosphorylase